MELSLGERRVGGGRPCLIAAEAGSAHRGDLARGLELVEAAAACGAGCVKFQAVLAEEIVHPLTGVVKLPGGKVPLYRRFKELERGPEFYGRLKERAEARGLLFLCSAFGMGSARMLRSLGVRAIKIASPELNHYPLLEEVAGYGIPLILSTGVSTLGDIERALAVVGSNCLLLHCVTAYPAPEEEYNLRLIPNLEAVFGLPVGVSDHSLDPLLVPALAVLAGACLVEKHFTLDPGGGGLDDPIALDPAAFALMAAEIRRLEGMSRQEAERWLEDRYGTQRIARVQGDGVKRLAASERANYRRSSRSLHALAAIAAGDEITADKVCVVRSEKNLSPGLGPEHLPAILGRLAQKAIPAGEGITWDHLLADAPGR